MYPLFNKSPYRDDIRTRKLLNPFLLPRRSTEAGYYLWKKETTSTQIWLFLVLGSIIIIFFGFMDIFFISGRIRSIFLCITFIGIAPFGIITAITFKLKKTCFLCELFIFLTLLITSICSVAIVILAKEYNFGQLYPILIIIILFSYFISSLQFIYPLIITAVTIILFIMVSIYKAPLRLCMTEEVLFLSLAGIVASIGGYSLECSTRNRYLQSEHLSYLAGHDGLTGLHNRRYFFEEAEIRWNQCQREKLPVTIMIADVDFFKNYNDYYGHVEGDTCLKKLAEVFISSQKRPFDIVARFGGEEFIFLWYDADFNFIQIEINNIINRVQALDIPHEKSKVNKNVTISAGAVLVVPTETISLNTAVIKADECLYRAKLEGRNRSIISGKLPK